MFPSEIYNSENFNSLTGQVQELTDISLGRGPSCEMYKISREDYSMNLAVPSAGPAPRGGLVVLISHNDTSLL